MRIELGSVVDLIDNYGHLFREHFAEVNSPGETLLAEVSPDRDSFEALEKAGILFTLLVRDDADQVVGYSVNIVHRHAHYNVRTAWNDTIFLRKANRGAGIGRELLRKTEEEAHIRGAAILVIRTKPGAVITDLLPTVGYALRDHVFTKEV